MAQIEFISVLRCQCLVVMVMTGPLTPSYAKFSFRLYTNVSVINNHQIS